MDVMFGMAYFLEKVDKLFPAAHQKLHFVVAGDRNALLVQIVHHERVTGDDLRMNISYKK